MIKHNLEENRFTIVNTTTVKLPLEILCDSKHHHIFDNSAKIIWLFSTFILKIRHGQIKEKREVVGQIGCVQRSQPFP